MFGQFRAAVNTSSTDDVGAILNEEFFLAPTTPAERHASRSSPFMLREISNIHSLRGTHTQRSPPSAGLIFPAPSCSSRSIFRTQAASGSVLPHPLSRRSIFLPPLPFSANDPLPRDNLSMIFDQSHNHWTTDGFHEIVQPLTGSSITENVSISSPGVTENQCDVSNMSYDDTDAQNNIFYNPENVVDQFFDQENIQIRAIDSPPSVSNIGDRTGKNEMDAQYCTENSQPIAPGIDGIGQRIARGDIGHLTDIVACADTRSSTLSSSLSCLDLSCFETMIPDRSDVFNSRLSDPFESIRPLMELTHSRRHTDETVPNNDTFLPEMSLFPAHRQSRTLLDPYLINGADDLLNSTGDSSGSLC